MHCGTPDAIPHKAGWPQVWGQLLETNFSQSILHQFQFGQIRVGMDRTQGVVHAIYELCRPAKWRVDTDLVNFGVGGHVDDLRISDR
jgi:hypothetical protein